MQQQKCWRIFPACLAVEDGNAFDLQGVVGRQAFVLRLCPSGRAEQNRSKCCGVLGWEFHAAFLIATVKLYVQWFLGDNLQNAFKKVTLL